MELSKLHVEIKVTVLLVYNYSQILSKGWGCGFTQLEFLNGLNTMKVIGIDCLGFKTDKT